MLRGFKVILKQEGHKKIETEHRLSSLFRISNAGEMGMQLFFQPPPFFIILSAEGRLDFSPVIFSSLRQSHLSLLSIPFLCLLNNMYSHAEWREKGNDRRGKLKVRKGRRDGKGERKEMIEKRKY